MLRDATIDDLDALVALEERCFASDRLSRRSFRRMIARKTSALVVAEVDGALHGYVLVLFHAGTPLARLYSVAVAPEARGSGLGRELVSAAEEHARANDCVALRLEVRRDNTAALALYHAMGYRQFGVQEDYYEDHMDAVRMQKSLVPPLSGDIARVPYYEQTLEFTCGPASLLMAMQALGSSLTPDRALELRIWREATTVFMTSGMGGCGPHGLALSAHHRGFGAEVWLGGDETGLFVDGVRDATKKEIIRLVQSDQATELEAAGIPLHRGTMSVDEMQRAFEAGGIPLVLISSWRLYRRRTPHWVVVTGFDDHFVYLHDPFVDVEEGKARVDCVNMPVSRREFSGMARYGRQAQRAVVVITAGTT